MGYYVVQRQNNEFMGPDNWEKSLDKAERFQELPKAMLAARIASTNNTGEMRVLIVDPRVVATVTAGADAFGD